MAEAKHTATPWRCCKVNKRWLIYAEAALSDGINWFIAQTRADRPDEERANAEHIVTCVNAHDSLTADRTRLAEENARLRAVGDAILKDVGDILALVNGESPHLLEDNVPFAHLTVIALPEWTALSATPATGGANG